MINQPHHDFPSAWIGQSGHKLWCTIACAPSLSLEPAYSINSYHNLTPTNLARAPTQPTSSGTSIHKTSPQLTWSDTNWPQLTWSNWGQLSEVNVMSLQVNLGELMWIEISWCQLRWGWCRKWHDKFWQMGATSNMEPAKPTPSNMARHDIPYGQKCVSDYAFICDAVSVTKQRWLGKIKNNQ